MGKRLRRGFEDVVPVVLDRSEALDARIQGDHGLGHGVTGGIGVEAAVNLAPLIQQGPQPGRVRSGAGSGEAPVCGMEGKATDGIDGRFAQDQRGLRLDWSSVVPTGSEISLGGLIRRLPLLPSWPSKSVRNGV